MLPEHAGPIDASTHWTNDVLYWPLDDSEWPAELSRSNFQSNWKLHVKTRSCFWIILQTVQKLMEANRMGCWSSMTQKRLPSVSGMALIWS